jgi:hypothetical protein
VLHGREALLEGPKQSVRLVPGERTGWKVEGDALILTLTDEFAREMLNSLLDESSFAFLQDPDSSVEFQLPGLRLKFVADETTGEPDVTRAEK